MGMHFSPQPAVKIVKTMALARSALEESSGLAGAGGCYEGVPGELG